MLSCLAMLQLARAEVCVGSLEQRFSGSHELSWIPTMSGAVRFVRSKVGFISLEALYAGSRTLSGLVAQLLSFEHGLKTIKKVLSAGTPGGNSHASDTEYQQQGRLFPVTCDMRESMSSMIEGATRKGAQHLCSGGTLDGETGQSLDSRVGGAPPAEFKNVQMLALFSGGGRKGQRR